MHKRLGVTTFIAVLASLIWAGPAPAQPSQDILNFLQTVACTQLPEGACEALNADNAGNILATYGSLLAQKYCGSGNFNEARELLKTDAANDSDKCRKLLTYLHYM